jgi:hypothetical protein
MAAESSASLVLCALRLSRVFRRRVRRVLEYGHYSRPLSRLQPSMALDGMFELRRVVVTCGLVRQGIEERRHPPRVFDLIDRAIRYTLMKKDFSSVEMTPVNHTARGSCLASEATG